MFQATKGAGSLYARRERQPLLNPPVVSWGWQAHAPGVSPFQDYFGWIGTDDPAAYLSVPAAIDFQAGHDWPGVRAACHQLAAEARESIAALTGLPQICPDGVEWWTQMCAVPLPLNGQQLARSCGRICGRSTESRRRLRTGRGGASCAFPFRRIIRLVMSSGCWRGCGRSCVSAAPRVR